MQRETFSTIVYIKRSRLLKNGEAPIFFRITYNGKRAEISSKKSINPSLWDEKRARVKGKDSTAKSINRMLEIIMGRLNDTYNELLVRNREISADIIKISFLGIKENERTILQIFREHNEKAERLIGIDLTAATVERYKTCYNHTANYIAYEYRQKDLSLSKLNNQFIKDYKIYLKTECACNHNTTVKYLKNFKKITRIALSNKWLEDDPFRDIKFTLQDVDKEYLDKYELERLIEKQFDIPRLEQIKDVFLFCCFTGLAFSDVKGLNEEHLVLGIDGNRWIKKKRQKTKKWCHIPILDIPKAIIEKYSNNPECISKNVLLPVTSNQKMNAYLKEIADLSGIKKDLSTHSARHTFATTVTLANHISMEAVSKMLGHSSISMTKKYARIVDDLISDDMQKLQGKYKVG